MEDFDRPLNERGNRDAPAMAKRLLKKDINIDLFVSSPAKRAFATATYFAEAYDIKQKNIIQQFRIIRSYVLRPFTKLLSGLTMKLNQSHCFRIIPGITDFVNSLTHTTN